MRVDGAVVGAIDAGLVVLVGVTHADTEAHARRWPARCTGCGSSREHSIADDPDGAILAISQFTLYGDARKGRRPTWAAAAPGPVAEPLVDAFVAALRGLGARVETGVFGAQMQVELVNDGPMTLLLEA